MRDEDVVDADRVCAEVLYSTFAGELESVRAARQHARIRHLLEHRSRRVLGGRAATAASRASGSRSSARASGASRSSAWPRPCRAAASAASCSRAAGPTATARAATSILSSPNPQAMGTYAHTGLPIRPCVAAAGIPDLERAPDVDDVIEAGEAGIAVADAIGRELRGAGHGRDLPVPMAHGARLLVFEDRAFAVGARQQYHPARRPRRAGRPARCCGPCSPAPGRGRRSTSTSSRPGRTGRCRCAWTRGSRCRPTGRCSRAASLGPLAPYIPSGAYL